jgi:hypothetical protein
MPTKVQRDLGLRQSSFQQRLPGDKQDENLATIRMRKMTPAA